MKIMVRENQNHNKFCGSPEIRHFPLRTCSGELFLLKGGIFKTLIIIHIIVLITIIVIGHRQQLPAEAGIIKAPPPGDTRK